MPEPPDVAGLRGVPDVLAASAYPFEEVPSSASRITWTHTAGKSPEKYLPETTGAGCAFLDYDNDGWMDIYLVNSGKCDFYNPNPPLRNALYRNNRDGTFTDVTEKAGVAAGGYGQGVAVGDYNGDGFPDHLRDAIWTKHSVPQQRRRHVYRCDGEGRRRRAGMELERGVVRLRQRRAARPVRLPVRRVQHSEEPSLRRANNKPGYCIPTLYKPMPSWLFHNNGDGTFTDVSKIVGNRKASRQGLGSGGDRHQQRRQDGSLRFQRHDGELPLHESWQRQVRRDRALAGWRYSETGRARSGMGVDSADFNQDGWMDLFVANIDHERYSLYQNNHDETFDDQAGPTGHRRGDPPDERLGAEVFRL